jgi:hypothetical protein
MVFNGLGMRALKLACNGAKGNKSTLVRTPGMLDRARVFACVGRQRSACMSVRLHASLLHPLLLLLPLPL